MTTAETEAFDRSSLPTIATTPVAECAVCGGSRRSACARGYDFELRTCANEWVFVSCDGCGHVWLDPRPDVATLGVIYPAEYYAYDYESRVHPIARWAKGRMDAMKLGRILREMSTPPRSYMDVGCGSGRYLAAMSARGLRKRDIHGLELNDEVVARLSADGYSVACQRVEDANVRPASLDLVTMFHVLEHVSDPAGVVGRIAEWLAPGGLVAIETPNLDSTDRRLFAGRFWGGYHFPRHWHLFSPRTLTSLTQQAGLEPVTILYQTGHSFWMYSLHHALRYGNRPVPRLARFFDPMKSLVLLAGFTAADKARAALGARTSSMLLLARRPA
jgi:2-polyprenyl-3-methyl-5-hydroxy-6-metoxy-1,4-benzoquinol methylase